MKSDLVERIRNHRFDGYSIELLAVEIDTFRAGRGIGSVSAAVEALRASAAAMLGADQTLRTELAALGVVWESSAGWLARSVMGEHADFADDAKDKLNRAAEIAFSLGEAFNRTLHKLPDSQTLLDGAAELGLGDRLGSLIGYETDHAAKVKAANAARNQAVDALNSYARDCGEALARVETFVEPEAIVLRGTPVEDGRSAERGYTTIAQVGEAVGARGADALPKASAPAPAAGPSVGAASGAACPPQSSSAQAAGSARVAAGESARGAAASGAAGGGVASRPAAQDAGQACPPSGSTPAAAGTPSASGGPSAPAAPQVPGAQAAPGAQPPAGSSGGVLAPGAPGAGGGHSAGSGGQGAGRVGGGPAALPTGGGLPEQLAKGKVAGVTPPAPPSTAVGPGLATQPAPSAPAGGSTAGGAAVVGAAGAAGAASGEPDRERRSRGYGKDTEVDGRMLYEFDPGHIEGAEVADAVERIEPAAGDDEPAFLEQAAPQEGQSDHERVRRHAVDAVDLFADDRLVARDVIGDDAAQAYRPEDRSAGS